MPNRACEFLPRKNFQPIPPSGMTKRGKFFGAAGTPPPHPLNGLLGAGFAKSVCKNRITNDLEVNSGQQRTYGHWRPIG